jgi:hypothetical protein
VPLAAVAEQLTLNPKTGGSNPNHWHRERKKMAKKCLNITCTGENECYKHIFYISEMVFILTVIAPTNKTTISNL